MTSTQESLYARRQRTVAGSCWPCKRRRVKCDLRKPSCRRCVLSGTTCNYNALNIRWTRNRSKLSSRSEPQCNLATLALELRTDERALAYDEKRALDYFIHKLWPLLSTTSQPCLPPISLALRFEPVLQTMCFFAESHRAVQEGSTTERTLSHRRLNCLSSIRRYLDAREINRNNLSPLLTAVLFLYLLDGFVDCGQQHASTNFHYAGALALVEALGGFQKTRASSSKEMSMLLSEFASTDLTSALLQCRRPCLPSSIWHQFESQPVWWETSRYHLTSLASIFETMAEMSFYLHSVEKSADVSFQRAGEFERKLQPTYLLLDQRNAVNRGSELADDHQMLLDTALDSFYRAFRHAALIYLYRAICPTPTHHPLVQQHVNACLECIRSLGCLPNFQKCALFPLYIAGAHALTEAHRTYVMQELDTIYGNIRFESVLCIKSSLQIIWQAPDQPVSWSDTFKDFTGTTLVL